MERFVTYESRQTDGQKVLGSLNFDLCNSKSLTVLSTVLRAITLSTHAVRLKVKKLSCRRECSVALQF